MSQHMLDRPVASPPQIVPGQPGEGARLMGLLAQFADSMGQWAGVLFQLQEAALGDVVSTMLSIAQQAEAVAALAAADALSRGTVANSTATGAPGWVAQYARGIDPVVVRRVATVGVECGEARNLVVAESLAAGSASVSAALVALREVPRTLPLLPTANRDEMLLNYLSLTGFGTRALRELSTRIIGRHAPERLVRDEARQQECESVFWSELPNGLTRFIAELSGAHAATVKHALSALSAPAAHSCPPEGGETALDGPGCGDDSGDAAEPDRRTPAKRRADALIRLVETAAQLVDADAARPVGEVGGLAKLVVTMDYDTLYAGLRDADRCPTYLPGIGRCSDGEHLDAGTLRRLACDADIIPVVLGGDSEPLDVGRAKRLFTGGLRTAIIHRDRGCTFPGCDRPPDWCDAHHVQPWWVGGETSLDNAALLCARHHTIVHRDLLTAEVTSTGVVWNPTPGLMASRSSSTE